MKRHCLPCYLIASKVLLMLVAIASTVMLTASIHEAAQQPNTDAIALKRMFVYQILVNTQAD